MKRERKTTVKEWAGEERTGDHFNWVPRSGPGCLAGRVWVGRVWIGRGLQVDEPGLCTNALDTAAQGGRNQSKKKKNLVGNRSESAKLRR